MHWNSVGEFFAMGGYASTSGAVSAPALLLMVAEPLLAGSVLARPAKPAPRTDCRRTRHQQRIMKPRQKRIALIVGGLASLGIAAALALNALDSNIALYVTPTRGRRRQGAAGQGLPHRRPGQGRLGQAPGHDRALRRHRHRQGYPGRLHRHPSRPVQAKAKAWWCRASLAATAYFTATEVLAKHDENYMPPEAKHAVDQAQQTRRRPSSASPRGSP
jgi:cytochrome c-type biogenesis protein CcmE